MLEELTTLYLSAGYDVKFNFGIFKEHKIVNPYEFLKSEFNDQQIKAIKSMGKLSNMEIIFNRKKAANKLISNLDLSEFSEQEIDQMFDAQMVEKLKKYQPFRGYMNQILNEI